MSVSQATSVMSAVRSVEVDVKVTISPVSGDAGAMSNDAAGGWLGTVIVFVAVLEPPS